ncbi:MAG: NfeD family protein [Acidimicrobiales bacterium]
MSSDADDVVGRVCRITSRVRGADGPGEVLVAIRGGTDTYLAYADDEISAGTEVVVVAKRPGRAVDVRSLY